jgi:hypothetical protein
MFKFDRDKLSVSYNQMKSCTTALGGSMHIIDPDAPEGTETFKKVDVPFAVMRKFVAETKITKYIKPVEIAVLRYDGQVINIERDLATGILNQGAGERWTAKMETFVNDHLDNRLEDLTWYFDGRYIFNLEDAQIERLRGPDWSPCISSNGTFRSMQVNCIDLYEANKPVFKTGVVTEERGVIAYVEGDAFCVTPPIWKNVDAIGSSVTIETDARSEHEDYLDVTRGVSTSEERFAVLIDLLDKNFNLNLNFTLNSAKAISNIFGFDAVEPLQLPEIMLELSTVNIPSLPKSIKSTFCIGLRPSHGLAWLMGLLNKTETLEDYVAIRAVIKYLTTKGIFHSKSVEKTNLFATKEHTIPPMLDISTITVDPMDYVLEDH